jgi:single-strand selective monofunctional uracil DNA glycosylase
MSQPKVLEAAGVLRDRVRGLKFPGPVSYVYHPLDYAWKPHRIYLQRFGKGRRDVILVGMNPGPFGMAQTGVPFGDVEMVTGWLGIEAPVETPERQHPKRPVKGFDCHRGEVSGKRLWGWAKDRFGSAENFFSTFFIVNYCPLLFLEEGGRNLTPDKLPAASRRELFEACDDHLLDVVRALRPKWLIGIGKFAQKRAEEAINNLPGKPTTGFILHPSPASPAANRGWSGQAEKQLKEMGVPLP